MLGCFDVLVEFFCGVNDVGYGWVVVVGIVLIFVCGDREDVEIGMVVG